MGKERRKNKGQSSSGKGDSAGLKPAAQRWRGRALLLSALVAGAVVHLPGLSAGWFYDDSDYVLGDPRLERMELFLPGHWRDAPPPLAGGETAELHLPGYDKPLLFDRYLWRLSFALERLVFGSPPIALEAHAVNLLLHLACVAALYLALVRLVRLYLEPGRNTEDSTGGQAASGTRANYQFALLPGLAALIFAVHPWAAEPVCYVSARNASMGTLFVLLGLSAWTMALQCSASLRARALGLGGALVCAVAAYGCKENFISAAPGYVLATWPVLWKRLRAWSSGGAVAAVIGGVALTAGVAWLGISASDRARGLFAQTFGGTGWDYFFTIQNPLLLLTLGDEIPARRLALETNHPAWACWACWAALLLNGALLLLGTLGAWRCPALLGLGWFYLHLLPTNSFLPRPDFLAARNVYLPTAGIAALVAGGVIYLFARLEAQRRIRNAVVAAAAVLWLCWAVNSFVWARAFADPEMAWARSAEIAPDHAAVRLNLAVAILNRGAPRPPGKSEMAESEKELLAALAAEDSPTMKYHTERPRAMRRALALRILANLRVFNERWSEAEEFFRKSFVLMPQPVTWAGWVEVCAAGNLRREMDATVEEGARHWPGKWWVLAARGLQKALRTERSSVSMETVHDLMAAEKAEDAAQPEMRSLQMRALFALAQDSSARARAPELIKRLRGLGLAENDVRRLENMVGK